MNIFSGEKNGRVKTREIAADMNRIWKLLRTAVGTG